MAVREVSMGRVYSESDLRKLGIYPTGYQTKDIISVFCPPWHLERNGVEIEYFPYDFSVGDSYLRYLKKENVLRGKIEDELDVYTNHSKIYLVEGKARKKIIHLCYSMLGSIILDECTKEKRERIDKGLAKRGFVEFRLRSGIKDPPMLEQAINMNILGIVTYDKEFGKDNMLKGRGYIDSYLKMNLEKEYEKIKDLAYETTIVCNCEDSVKTINKKINRFIKRKVKKISFGSAS